MGISKMVLRFSLFNLQANLRKLTSLCFLFFCTLVTLSAHGVQVVYCITDNGTIRIYIEHWHGNITAAQTATGAQVQIIVDDGTTVTNNFYPAQGVVWDTPIGSLPDCKEATVFLSGCTNASGGRNMNTQNDWVYWDFAPPSCGSPLTLTVNAIQGPSSWYFDEGCSNLYPTSFTATFDDCAPPVIECAANLMTQVDAGACTDNVTSNLEPNILFDDCTQESDLIITHDITGATVRSGSGFANGLFNKGISTVTYTVEDNTGKTTMCSFDVEVVDNTGPINMCPSTLTLECGDANNSTLISDWLNSFTATDGCGVMSLSNNYDPNGFAIHDEENPNQMMGPYAKPIISTGLLSHSLLKGSNLLNMISDCQYSEDIQIEDISGEHNFDFPVQTRVKYQSGMALDYSDLMFLDSENRVLPYWIESYNKDYANLWIKVAELEPFTKSTIKLKYGGCVDSAFGPEDVFKKINKKGKLHLDNPQSGGRILAKLKSGDTKNNLFVQGDNSNYKLAMGFTPDGNLNSQIIRLQEDHKPWPLYLEGNQTYGDAVYLEFERNEKHKTTTHILRNESGKNVIQDKFVDDGFILSDQLEFAEKENIEFIVELPLSSYAPKLTSNLTLDIPTVPLRTFEVFETLDDEQDAYGITKKSMPCDCTVTQGAQSFNINAIQNAEDDVAFYSYSNPAGASSNTGLEMSEAVVLFLYENTLTGEISLFILIDIPSDPTGGAGTIDFFCLPSNATLDFSDDPGEITGIFPTVTANWRWAPCCTDGALIGNVGCNTTFDFYANFTSGINQIKWASGTLAAPVYNTFNSSTAPVRITCGNAQPTCCANSNSVSLTDATCPSSTNGAVNLSVDPGGAPYTFNWSNGATTEDISGLAPGTYTVSVTDKDNCEQIIDNVIGVDEIPMLSCPANVTVSMSGTMASIALTDLGYTVSYPCPDNYTETCLGCGDFDCADQNSVELVTVRVEDVLGNTDECMINVFIENLPPDITCPADLNLECADPTNNSQINTWLSTVSATDAEGAVVSIVDNYTPGSFSFDEEEGSGSFQKMKSSGKQSIQGPNDYYYVLEVIEETQKSFSSAAVMMSMKGKQVVTFTATDECGNTSTCTATIVIDDTTPPTITCPDDITIECGNPNNDATITNWLATADYYDACNPTGLLTNNYANNPTGGCGDTGSETVTFTANDECGNTATCNATITVEDNMPPTLLMKPQDITVDCINSAGNNPAENAWVAINGGAMAEDDCDNNLTWTRTTGPEVATCGYGYSQDYTFIVTDDCGNSSSAMATFTVIDETPPVLNMRADVTVNCSTANPAQLTNFLSSGFNPLDDCMDNADIDVSYVLFNTDPGCGGTSTETYLFTATDDCGNQTTGLWNFTIQDNAIPTWSGLPGTLIIECGDPDNSNLINDWISDIEDSMFDACGGDLVITNNWDGTLNRGCRTNTVITFTLTDECGNTRNLNRTIQIRDTTAPVFVDCPSDMTVNVDAASCDANIIFSTPIAYDDCDNVVTSIQTAGPNSGSTFPLGDSDIVFEAMDMCGNMSDPDCEFTITVVDSGTPSIDCPSNMTRCVEAGSCIWTSDGSIDPIATENCTARTIDYDITGATTASGSDSAAGVVFNLGTSTLCYTISDGAGSSSSCCFDVIIEDCENPVVTCPMDVTFECDGTGNAADIAGWLPGASASDNCDVAPSITNSAFNNISDCGASEMIVYQFTAEDAAGNTHNCYATVTIEDTTDPNIDVDAVNELVECDPPSNPNDLFTWLSNQGSAIASDDCGSVVWSHDFDALSPSCGATGDVTVVFTATDECGNTATSSADFAIDDTQVPVITCPEDITLECNGTANDAVITNWLTTATATDDCGNVIITNDDPGTLTASCGATGSTVYVFTATDECGNIATCSASIEIEDSVPPTFDMKPQDTTVECDGAGNAATVTAWLANNADGMATDFCSTLITWNNTLTTSSTDCGAAGSQSYLFTISDECSNSTSATATFFIEDTTPPTLTVPADQTFECDGTGNGGDITTWLSGAAASDICSAIVDITSEIYNTTSACGGGFMETYIFIATDECGNESTDLATVTIEDTVDPAISCPANLVLECGADENPTLIIAWLTTATISDASTCSAVVLSNDYDGTFPANCGGSLPVTFTATDDCGRSSNCIASITLDDVTTPDFMACPSDMTINVDLGSCGSNPIFSTPQVIDNCNVTVAQTGGPASGTAFPVGTTPIEFTATDDCGNTELCTFNITVVDSSAPDVDCPADITVCTDGGCMWASTDLAPNTGFDNCPGYTITYDITGETTATGSDDATGTSFNLGVSQLCYTVEDAASNTASCCFFIEVIDCEAPEISCPADTTVECDGLGNPADLATWIATVSATDNCNDTATMDNAEVNNISACGDSEIIEYEFTAEDAAGNVSSCTARFTIEDMTPPSMDVPASNLTEECNGAFNTDALIAWLNSNGGADASDDCGLVTWSHDFDMALMVDCGATGNQTVNFTATDECGNTAVTTALFTIEDTTDPLIDCPQNIFLECGNPSSDAIIATWVTTASGTDDCGNVSISHNYPNVFTADCGTTGEYTVTFTATDDCGNTSTCERTIAIQDETVPAITLHAEDLIVECASPSMASDLATWIDANGGATSEDACDDNLTWTNTPLPSSMLCGDTEETTYIFTATDDCGNTSSTTAVFRTEDTTPPSLIVPVDATVECDGTGNLTERDAWLATVSGTDDCSTTVVTDFDLFNSISGCGGASTDVFVFIATDACGNTSTDLASFTIEDSTEPSITCPEDLVLECGDPDNDQLVLAWLDTALGIDASDCSMFTISHDYPGGMPDPLTCNGGTGIGITFTITDDCSNAAECLSTITMDDTVPPYFINCHDDVTLSADPNSCERNVLYSLPIGLDQCDDMVDVTRTAGLASGAMFPVGTTTVTYLAEDDCGNTFECTFDITIEDGELPELECPSNDVIKCTDTGVCTWTADDDVNALSRDFCGIMTLTYDIAGATTAASPATGENYVGDDAVVFMLGTSTVTYTIEDESGNTSTCSFDVIVSDCEDPEITCSDELDIDCGSENLAAWMTAIEATATDNCDLNADLTVTNTLITDFSSCGGTFDRVYQFVVEDQAGNSSQCMARYSTIDNVPPVIAPAVSQTLECDGTDFSDDLTAWINNNGGASFTSDNCDDAVIWTNNFIGGMIPDCGNAGSVTVTFTATDDCGNTSTTEADFEVVDTTVPEITCPANMDLVCADPSNTNLIDGWIDSVTAIDDCDNSVDISFLLDETPDCGATSETEYVFTATDDCGNTATCLSVITISDTDNPTIELDAADLNLECADAGNAALMSDWEASFGGAIATDACSDEPLIWSILSRDETLSCGSTSSILYTFQVEDNCGNVSTTQASVIFTDTTAPDLVLPADATLECGTMTGTTLADFLAGATATDDCGAVTITNEIWNTISGCGATDSNTYLFTATDECGNVSTGLATHTIEDTQDPVLTCPTMELELECGDPTNASLIAAWLNTATASDPDDCNSVVISNDYPGGLPFPLECNGGAGIMVTFTASDDCDNTSACMSTITMDDSLNPYFNNCPSDLTVSIDSDACDSRVIYPTPSASDDCDDLPTVTLIDGIPSGESFPLGTTTITFETVDECGNTARCEFDVTVEDTDLPSLACPVNDVIKCADPGVCNWLSTDATDPIIADNCVGLTLNYDIVFADASTNSGSGTVAASSEVFPLGTSTVTYTLTDGSGNVSTCSFDVIINDCEVPEIICTDDLDVLCSEEDLATWVNAIAATATDNCDPLPDLVVAESIQVDFSSCGNTIDQIYLFVVEDLAGNQSSCTARYTSNDDESPVISGAVDEIIECSMDEVSDDLLAWLSNNGGAAFVSDNCADDVSWSNDYTTALSDDCAATGEISVEFTATDDCGNTSTTSAVFRVIDTVDPIVTCPADITLECAGSENDNVIINWLDQATVTDACDDDIVISNDFGTAFTEACGETGEHLVVFSVTDACSNGATCSATITIEDTTSPSIEVSAMDLSLECADAGNAAAITAWESNQGGATAMDACSDEALVWTILSQTPAAGCGDGSTTEYVFQVEDNCGNTSLTSASIIINDTTPPELTVPENQIEECGDIATSVSVWIAEATGTDDCGDVTLAAQLWNTISGCGNTNTEQYLFTATDDCGNQTTGFAEYTIEDTSDPIIECPANLSIECGDPNNTANISAWLATAIILDEYDCNDITLSNNYLGGLPAPLTCNAGAGLLITFTVTDACANTSTCNSTITMDDTTIPTFVNCPTDMTVNVDVDLCSSNIIYSTPIADDECDNDVDVSLISGISSGQSFPLGTTTIVFEAEDDCDNVNTCTFDITVIDSDTPAIQCPSNDVILCTDPTLCTWESDTKVDPLIGDNCTGYTLTYFVGGATTANSIPVGQNTLDGDNVIFNIGTSNVTYVVEDGSGNTSTCSFIVTIEDCESPSLTCADEVVDCNAEDVPAWTTLIAGTAMDNCDANANLTVTSQLITDISSCGNTLNQTYLFVVTDQSGNSSECSATLYTTDSTVPSIDTPATDELIECSNENYAALLIAWLSNNGGAVASDLCSMPITWTNDFGGDLNETCGGVGSSTVIFTATDDCGNTSTTSASFVVEDNTAATIVCPGDITVECGEPNNNILVSSWLSNSLAADNCGGVSTTNDFTALPDCGETLTVTFTVVGNCDGELVECTADITVEDTQKPVIMSPPADLFLECDGAGNVAEIDAWLADNTANDITLGMMAVDNCAAVTITSEEIMRTDDCGASTIISYRFTATDDCGNAISEVAKVHVSDSTIPVITAPTATDSVECDADVDAAITTWLLSATATDICGSASVEFTLLGQTNTCDGTVTQEISYYQFTATDDCGNQVTTTAQFTLEDNVAPVITAPEDLVVACGDNYGAAMVAWLMDYSVVETCQNFTVTNDFDGTIPDICGGTEVITWTVEDDCGASSTATASIIIEDDVTPPSIDYCPADLTITTEFGQCDAILNYPTPTASDCNAPVVITKSGGLDIGSMINAGDVETIEFTATDACGNISICTFTVTVLDEQLPYISCPSNDVIKCNDAGVCTWTSDDDVSPIDLGDNCNDIVVTYELTGATLASGMNDAAGEIFNLGTTTVCYTIADANGNNAVTCCFDVVINDCEAPEFMCSDNLLVDCGLEDLATWLKDIEDSATDNCMSDILFDVLPLTDVSSCGSTFERSYLFTVTDDAGNASTCTATYSTVDNISPTIDMEADDLILQCDGSNQSILFTAWLNSNGGAEASDACSEPLTWSNDFTGNVTTLCGTASEIDITFTVTDACGNASTTMGTFRIEDTTPPVLTLPNDLELECNNPLNSFLTTIWLNGATASDNCQTLVTVQNDFPGVITDLCGETTSHLITFTSTDACDNAISDTRVITFIDVTPPTIISPAMNLVLECAGDFQADIDLWLDNNGGALAADDCSDEDLVWTYTEVSSTPTCGDAGETIYNFVVTDNCGNQNSTTGTIVIEDNTDPEITLPADAVEECGNINMTVDDWMALITTSDLCGDVDLETLLWSTIPGCGSTFIERYLFTATDECGNSSTAFGEYRTVDSTDPVVTCPDDLILECGDKDNPIMLSAWLLSGTAIDVYDCSNVSVLADPPSSLPDLDCDGISSAPVLFTATDECGNTSDCTAYIFVNDTTDPEFLNCPQDLTVNVDVDLCGANPIYSSPVASDNCAASVLHSAGPASGTTFDIGENEIEFITTDDCGNSAVCTFMITVVDSDVPMILCPSNMVVVETDPGVCTWTSNDKVNPSVSFENCPDSQIAYTITGATVSSGTDNAEGEVFNLGVSEVCYTITDASDNESTCCFTVTVEDNELPEIECPRDTLIVATTELNGVCLGEFMWNHPDPTDNCGIDSLNLDIEFPDGSTDQLANVTPNGSETYQFPAGFNILTYTVWDVNGNSATCEFEVEILGIKHEKTIASVTQNPDDSYCIEYNVRVWNTGNNVGFYTLDDIPAFDDDFNILSAEYYSSIHFTTALSLPVPVSGWNLAVNQPLIGYQQHNYVMTVCVLMDLKDPNTPGDGLYTLCDDDGDGDLEAGEGLYNETFLDANSDGNVDMRDTVCADIPYITHEKDFVGYESKADCSYDAVFKITVQNIGGEPGIYDLWDQPFFDDDFVINSASYTTDAPGHAANPSPVSLTGTGPWTLADDQGLIDGGTSCYYLTVNVSIDLSDPSTVGDEIYDWCGSSKGGIDAQGQGLYNESYLDRSNDGTPEELEETCGDIEIVDLALTKKVVTAAPYAYSDIIEFEIEVFNQGNIPLQNIQINDYLPSGYNFTGVTGNDPNWMMSAQGLLIYADINGPLLPNRSVTIPLLVELVQTQGGYKDWENYSEIRYVEDENGVDRSNDDIDSQPDNDSTNDNQVCQDDPDDNNIYGAGPQKNEDEDDHDPAGISVFDLALRKTFDAANSTVAYGGTVRFDIEIFNQGNEDAKDICVADYLPCGLGFDSNSTLNTSNNWVHDLTTNQVKTTLTSILTPGSSTFVSIDLVIQDCYQADAWDNYAEITQADDNDPLTTGLPDDIDSTPDNTNGNDNGGTPNVAGEDDEINDGGLVDEDDHDPERVEIFDLALKKIIDNPGPYSPGSLATFKIRVFNQGNIPASNILINDYLNSGFLFDPNVNAGWTNNAGTLEYTIPTTLMPADSTEVLLDLEVFIDSNPSFSDWINYAEIGYAEDSSMNVGDDIDSTPDSDAAHERAVLPNDPDDNNICGHGPNCPTCSEQPQDEDDHDPEGILVVGKIGNLVWKDLDGNGIYDNGEPGLPGVIVNLLDCDGNLVGSMTTDSEGKYSFNEVIPGDYMLHFDISSLGQDCAFTFRDLGSDMTDSDVNIDGETSCFTVNAGDCYEDVFAGVLPLASIGNYVWHDINGNGIQENNEPPIPGVTVELYDSSGNLISVMNTDANGYYCFTRVYPGDYYLKFSTPTNLGTTISNAGGNDALDSDIDGSNGPGTTSVTTLNAGEDDKSWDAGFYICVKIGETVWLDYNENDVIDPQENGINGLTIELWKLENGSYVLIDSELSGHKPNTPSDDGYFKFCTSPGTYYLKFKHPPTSLVPVVPNFGINELLDSDVTGKFGAGTTDEFTVVSGDEKCDLAAGYYTMATIGSRVWQDNNGNGMRENNEPGVAGVVVRAFNMSGSEVSTQTTNSQGEYLMDYLGKDNYYLKFDVPPGLTSTYPNMGADESMDSDVDGSNGYMTTKLYNVNPGDNIPNVDAGVIYSVLAIDWLDFWGERRANHNFLEWQVESDVEISHFDIEKSVGDTDNFTFIGKVLSTNSNIVDNYNYSDFNIQDNVVEYYRIKQYGLDGSQSYSKTISIQSSSKDAEMSVRLYPNPVVDELSIDITFSKKVASLNVDIYDVNGKLVKSNIVMDIDIDTDKKSYKVKVDDLAKGMYNLVITLDDREINKKLIVISQ